MRASVRRRLLGRGLPFAIGIAIGLEFILNSANSLFQIVQYGVSLKSAFPPGDLDGGNVTGHFAVAIVSGVFGLVCVLLCFHFGRDVFDGIVSSARTFKMRKGLARKVLVTGFSIQTMASCDYATRLGGAVAALKANPSPIKRREKAVALANALGEDNWRQAAFADAASGRPAPWQQNYRMIKAQFAEQAVPRLIVLVPPSDFGGEASSPSQQADLFITFIKYAIALLQIAYDIQDTPEIICFEPDGHVPYQDYNLVVSALLSAIDLGKGRGFEAENVCIDVTSGLKTFSIAAASVTMRYGTVFSYVPTGRETPSDASLYEPVYYDIQVDRADML